MAETILTPGQNHDSQLELTPVVSPDYLTKDNMLSEFGTESEKSVVRYNLGVPAAEDVYTKEEVEPVIIDKIRKKIAESLDSSDFITRATVEALLENFVRLDGSTPFRSSLAGVEPKSNHDLTTKRYVDSLILTCLKQVDKSKILELVENLLKDYVRESDVYTKNEVYTKSDIDNKNTQFMKSDGTTPFTRPVSGRTPSISSHLTTKKYVDELLETHKQDIDPHGFIEKLTNKLKKYALADLVYDKNQTYSRGQIDYIIDRLVAVSVEEALGMHLLAEDPHGIISKVKEIGYVLPNGTTPFREPQSGQDAVNPLDLVTLHQVEEKINEKEPIWITSGNVETTVGFVEDNQEMPEQMTFLEIMDAIFYGKLISLTVPEYVTIGNTGEIIVCVHGSTGLIQSAILYQEENPIYIFSKDDFEDGCVTVNSQVINKDTTFTFRVIYNNETVLEESKTVLCSYPIFVGLLPKWKFGNTITMSYLEELASEDSENNRFVNGIPSQIVQKYYFLDSRLRHPFVVIPEKYPNLDTMITKSLNFDLEAFDVIDMIPLSVEGLDIIYTIYIYRLALSYLNQEITFNFKV